MTPAARIVLDDIDITANLIPAPFGLPLLGGGVSVGGLTNDNNSAPLLSLTVTDAEGLKSDSVELAIDNREQIPAPKKGAKMKVWLGYVETGLVYMGSYSVDQWRKRGRPRTLTVTAKAVDLTGDLKSPKSRSFHDTTVGEIVDTIAQKNEMQAQVHADLRKVKIGHIDQSSESDIHFLTRLSKRVGGTFKPANDGLVMNKPGSRTLPSGADVPVFTIKETGTTDWDATGSERGAYKSASAVWIDPRTGERSTIVRGETGKSALRFRDRRVYKTEAEAERAAESALEGLGRGKVSLTIELPGMPELFAGAHIDAQEFDPDVDMTYLVKTTTHTLDSSGLRTSTQNESLEGANDDEESDKE